VCLLREGWWEQHDKCGKANHKPAVREAGGA